MAVISRRRFLGNFIAQQLKLINGGTSTFDPTYTYQTDLGNRVYRGWRWFDEINDFPTVAFVVGEERISYQSKGSTFAVTDATIRIFARNEKAEERVRKVITDIEHVIFASLPPTQNRFLDVIVNSIDVDLGLIEPYGFGEISITSVYELED